MLGDVRVFVAAILAICVAGVVVLVLAGDSTAGKAAAVTLLGVGCVLAVSMVFFAVGQSEDAERERAAAPPDPEPRGSEEPHPRPALDRRRPLPPRRPS
jgi:hypothetical protein